MTLHGHIERGKVVLDEDAAVPDGTAVVCVVVEETAHNIHPDVLRLTGIISPETNIYDAHLEWLEKKSRGESSD